MVVASERLEKEASRGREPLAERILEAIPIDRWVTTAEIAAQVGVSAHEVAGLIRYRIPHASVERRRERSRTSSHYIYRRLARVGEEKERGGGEPR